MVACYWVLEDAAPGTVQRVVPDGRPELILNLGQPFESLQNGGGNRSRNAFSRDSSPVRSSCARQPARGCWESASVQAAPASCSACRCRNSPTRRPAGDLGLHSLARHATFPASNARFSIWSAAAGPIGR